MAPLSGKYAAYGKAYLDGAQLAAEIFDDKRGPARVEIVPAEVRKILPETSLEARRSHAAHYVELARHYLRGDAPALP